MTINKKNLFQSPCVTGRLKHLLSFHWSLWLLALLFSFQVFARIPSAMDTIVLSQLPPEALQTLVLIRQGGPFPYAKDGVIFGNYENLLPKEHRRYYHEFTVPTPHFGNRGARRIVSGGIAPHDHYYYTDNHYGSFRRIVEGQ